MRILKTIRYKQLLLLKSVEEEETGANIKIFILWNLAAALFEGIKTLYKLKKQFINLKYYKKDYEKIDDILKEFGEQNSFTNSVLKVIRDKLAFHFDREVILEVIKEFTVYSIETMGEVVLFSGKTTAIKDLEYNIADNMDYNYILSLIETGDEYLWKGTKKITELLRAYNPAQVTDERNRIFR